jgi:hypothetical protein
VPTHVIGRKKKGKEAVVRNKKRKVKRGRSGVGGPMKSYAPVLRGNKIFIFGFNFRIDLGAQTGS